MVATSKFGFLKWLLIWSPITSDDLSRSLTRALIDRRSIKADVSYSTSQLKNSRPIGDSLNTLFMWDPSHIKTRKGHERNWKWRSYKHLQHFPTRNSIPLCPSIFKTNLGDPWGPRVKLWSSVGGDGSVPGGEPALRTELQSFTVPVGTLSAARQEAGQPTHRITVWGSVGAQELWRAGCTRFFW